MVLAYVVVEPREAAFFCSRPFKGRVGVGMGLTRNTNPPPSYPSP